MPVKGKNASLTILGCGGSLGVPLWGNNWGDCKPENPKNRRFRTAAMVDYNGKRFLIDTGPDLRQQALQYNVDQVDAVLYTHTHSDHIGGIDELRGLCWFMKRNIDIYGSSADLAAIKSRFPYLVPGGDNDLYPAFLNFHEIAAGRQIIQDCEVTVVRLDHVTCQPFGYRFGDIAYTTDLKYMPAESLDALKGIRHWVISCPFMQKKNHPTHAEMEQVLEWIDFVGPERAYLTHLGQNVDYDVMRAICPPNIEPCYDGMIVQS